MRLLARFVVLVATVSGVGLAFAWAWDRSDTAHRPADGPAAEAAAPAQR